MRFRYCMLIGAAAALFLAAAADLRTMQYRPGSAEEARTWQRDVRDKLAHCLRIDGLIGQTAPLPLQPEIVAQGEDPRYRWQEVQLQSTPVRKITVRIARPKISQPGKRPAVVCIAGHGGNRMTPFDAKAEIYKQFGIALTERGFIVISADIGRHEVYESGYTLMGERVWDLMRCVDYLATLPEVDANRIGCAGLSLGGEMAMWLGAMDERVKATVSSGFLTKMDQMEQNHCMCWKFDGLRALVDFPDIYGLIAPRALQCQNGLKEPQTQFTVSLAKEALQEIQPIYQALGAPDHVSLFVHDGGHEIAIEALLDFLAQALTP